ncbi:DUF3842 family protein [Anaerolentibacter hominis]|uniref:DUF3842 family protein n=1 Tax=Anaerolentibacter hominis TaxID=3079009 RepID=UPI0031B89624
MKKVIVIDGQGGKMGKAIVEELKKNVTGIEIYGIGTNSLATSAMLKAGAHYGATGENPIIVNSKDADIIVGPLGMVIANSLLGEITPAMAQAVGFCRAVKVLIPVNHCHCNNVVAGVQDVPLGELIRLAVKQVALNIED